MKKLKSYLPKVIQFKKVKWNSKPALTPKIIFSTLSPIPFRCYLGFWRKEEKLL